MKNLIAASTLLVPLWVGAATLQTLVMPLALPANATFTANDWSGTNTIPGIKWDHKGLKETPVAPSTRLGRIRLDGLPPATVFYSGVRSMMDMLTVTVGGDGNPAIAKDDFEKTLHKQFSAQAQIKMLRAGCPSEGATNGTSVFQIGLPGKKPIYVLAESESGGNTPNSETTMFQFSLEPETNWKCTP